MDKPISKLQIKKIQTSFSLLCFDKYSKLGEIARVASDCESIKDLNFEQAHNLLMNLDKHPKQESFNKMVRKAFALVHRLGWDRKKFFAFCHSKRCTVKTRTGKLKHYRSFNTLDMVNLITQLEQMVERAERKAVRNGTHLKVTHSIYRKK